MELLEFLKNPFFWFILIFAIFIAFLSFVLISKSKDSFAKNSRMIDSFPIILQTLGVLGTFVGITIGLQAFNVNDINGSIPSLLDGLKTAFVSSITGMIAGAILRACLDKTLDSKDNGISDSQQAIVAITKSIQDLSSSLIKSNTDMMSSVSKEIGKISSTQAAFTSAALIDIASIKESNNKIPDNLNSVVSAVNMSTTAFTALGNKLDTINGSISATGANLAKKLDDSTDAIKDVVENSSQTVAAVDEAKESIDSLKTFVHSEILDIEDKMSATNVLLTNKFDEFSTLLQKSNTEALVKAMEAATQEFQKTMGELVKRLVQENFDKLNYSVEQLNKWQQENKEMIIRLTAQYKEMADNFSISAKNLDEVSKNTDKLVGSNSLLSKLVAELQKVMVDDKTFTQISQNLQNAASSAMSNTQSLNTTSQELKNWINNQKEFRESIKTLLFKLEEINKIKDLTNWFWSDTKSHMEEGVSIIKNGTESLNKQIRDLDKQFYTRLSTTLAELDACISAMVNHYNNK